MYLGLDEVVSYVSFLIRVCRYLLNFLVTVPDLPDGYNSFIYLHTHS
jgi:hypothetical protein